MRAGNVDVYSPYAPGEEKTEEPANRKDLSWSGLSVKNWRKK